MSAIILPVTIRIIEMVFQFGVTETLHPREGRGPRQRFLIWDAQWYARIASHGYPHTYTVGGLDGHAGVTSGSELAFSPLYPALSRFLTFSNAITTNDALIIVSIVASCLLSVGVYLVSEAIGGSHQTNLLATFLIGALPMGVVFQMGYAEATYSAVCAFALLFAYKERWSTSATLGLVAGLGRPTGFVLAAGLLGVAHVLKSWSWRSLYAITLTICGPLLNWGIITMWTRDPTAFFAVQREGWGTKFDYGSSSWKFISHAFTDTGATGATGSLVALIVILHILLIPVLSKRAYSPFSLMLIVTMSYVLVLSNFWHSKPRLMLASFAIVIPLAHMCERLPRRIRYTLAISAVVGSMFFGASMIVEFPYAI